VFLGSLAVAVDIGMMSAISAKLRTGADAAALAGARLLDSSGNDSSGTAATAAKTIAEMNQYCHSGLISSVVVNIPPKSGSYVGKSGYVEAIVTFNQPAIFSWIWGWSTLPVSVRSVASNISTPYSNASVIVLDPSASGALTVNSGGDVVAASLVQVNSSSSTAVTASSAGYVQATNINIAGNYSTGASGHLYGTVTRSAATMADPLVSKISAPSTAGMTLQGAVPTSGTYTMNPGVYSGGVDIGSGMKVTMNPGIYYMKSGSFSVHNGAQLTGTGVTIYVDSGGGSFVFEQGETMTLSAPTSGPYAGVVMYLDGGSGQGITMLDGSYSNISGTIYAPSAAVTIQSGVKASLDGSQMICRTLTVTNGADVHVNWSSSTVARSSWLAIVE
jgi:Flp pilus assembly protein TadG